MISDHDIYQLRLIELQLCNCLWGTNVFSSKVELLISLWQSLEKNVVMVTLMI